MKIRYGPAAVIGDEIRTMSLSRTGWEDAESRLIRESEDRHLHSGTCPAGNQENARLVLFGHIPLADRHLLFPDFTFVINGEF